MLEFFNGSMRGRYITPSNVKYIWLLDVPVQQVTLQVIAGASQRPFGAMESAELLDLVTRCQTAPAASRIHASSRSWSRSSNFHEYSRPSLHAPDVKVEVVAKQDLVARW